MPKYLHRPDFVDVTTRTAHDNGFIKISAGFIVHGFSLFPARRFLIMDFRTGYSSIGEPQKITMYSPGRRRQFYNFILSNGTFLIIVKLLRSFYEPWYMFRSYKKRILNVRVCSRLVSQTRHIRSLGRNGRGTPPITRDEIAHCDHLIERRLRKHISLRVLRKAICIGAFLSRVWGIPPENRNFK
jgi:hypothetical protein